MDDLNLEKFKEKRKIRGGGDASTTPVGGKGEVCQLYFGGKIPKNVELISE